MTYVNESRIVIITSIVVAATAAAVSSRFDSFSTVGGIIGTSVSAAFLILLGLMNAYILYKLYKQMQKVLNLPEGQEDEAWKVEGGGIMFSVLRKMFTLINRYGPSVRICPLFTMLIAIDPGKCIPWVYCSVLDSIRRLKLLCWVSHPWKLREELIFGLF